jgi:hypothetical protein
MFSLIAIMIGVAVCMIAAHELGHVVATRILGGRWLGVAHKGFMVGVKLAVKPLSPGQLAITLAAGPAAEIFVTVAASLVYPQHTSLWVLIFALQWIGNVIPWGIIPNDGSRLLQLYRRGVIDSPQ